MSGDFDPEDQQSWYFGMITREETKAQLDNCESGSFLVRDSNTIVGGYVLCVKEASRICHYIINKKAIGASIRYHIGAEDFPNLPSLLNFYKTHYLDSTSLTKPAPRETFIGRYDFQARDKEDLQFMKGDMLTILQKNEDDWWMARNMAGVTGLVPSNYITKYDAEMEQRRQHHHQESPLVPAGAVAGGAPSEYRVPVSISNVVVPPASTPNGQMTRSLPAKAVVIKPRVPCAYDTSALRLEVGNEIIVTAMNINGQWEGELHGKMGLFPFTHVQFVDDGDDASPADADNQ